MLKKGIIFVIGFLLVTHGYCTHNRAGEITYRQISEYTFEFTIITFTNTKPTSDGVRPADRPELLVHWGDNTESVVNRYPYYDLPNYYRKNIYTTRHTFPAPGTYEILMEDPNRNEGVENIPNSVTVVFSIKTIMQINPVLGLNNTPVLLNPPVDKAAVGQIFIHNPAAFDPDGDSLSYELTTCLGENGDPIPSYQFPPSSHHPIFIDAVTGNLIWDAPEKAGIYNVAFLIEEWRKEFKIGQITRDMQIEVFDSDNRPPVIDTIPPICVVAGETVQFNVAAHDTASETITLTASGGVFEVSNPASFKSVPAKSVVTGLFNWNTDCSNVREQPYQVVFKATDSNAVVNLVHQQSTTIKVIGPPPTSIVLTPANNSIFIQWDTYPCTNAIGFDIYRKPSNYGFQPDKCQTGVPAYTGFTKIATISGLDQNSYLDNNKGVGLPQGYTYCYMLVAIFENTIESKASSEYCTELVRGTPIITNVSVTKNDESLGEIYLAWSKPIDFDTLKFPGPYQYLIKRATGIWGTDYAVVGTLNGLDDTTYIDKNFNTLSTGYSYQIEIHNDAGFTEWPMTASSIFPQLVATDKKIILSFDKNVPWTNYQYSVYRKSQEQSVWDSIGVTSDESYTDVGLTNGTTYCYQVKSYGAYDLPGIIKPIINYSHQNCGMPLDTVAPDAPTLQVLSDCKLFINLLTWAPLANQGDLMLYRIYYAADISSEFHLIDSVLNRDSLQYQHHQTDAASGCYAVTALDSNRNESNYSNVVCVDQCSFYELPNVFTPNNDNLNELLIPITPPEIIDQYIEKIDLKIYSRWGNLVFETTNPHINWDGKSSQTNRLVSPGVYYYVCDVYERRISGVEARYMVGFVHVFHNKDGHGNE